MEGGFHAAYRLQSRSVWFVMRTIYTTFGFHCTVYPLNYVDIDSEHISALGL